MLDTDLATNDQATSHLDLGRLDREPESEGPSSDRKSGPQVRALWWWMVSSAVHPVMILMTLLILMSRQSPAV